jgi:hypothetical protein
MAKRNTVKDKHYVCKLCDYHCNNQRDYTKHTMTTKHKTHIALNTSVEIKTYDCICNKSYLHMSSLSKHRSKCDIYKKFITDVKNIDPLLHSNSNSNSNNNYNYSLSIDQLDDNISNISYSIEDNDNMTTCKSKADILNSSTNSSLIHKLLIDIITQNKTDMREMLKEGNKEIKDMVMKEIGDYLKDQKENEIIQSTTYINNNVNTNNFNNINNNNKISLNIFLSENCNSAINMVEFIETLKIDSDSVEFTGKHGYAKGITKIFLDGLKQLDITQRPIHCADLKREIFYIRDNNKWEKDDEEKTQFKKALDAVVNKNMCMVSQWQKNNPRHDKLGTDEYEFHLVIMQQSLGGGSKDKREKGDKIIIRNIANEVYISRSHISELYNIRKYRGL